MKQIADLILTCRNIFPSDSTMMAYIPKATVQAAIGDIPLSLVLECGDMVLTVDVLAMAITAPIGAFLSITQLLLF